MLGTWMSTSAGLSRSQIEPGCMTYQLQFNIQQTICAEHFPRNLNERLGSHIDRKRLEKKLRDGSDQSESAILRKMRLFLKLVHPCLPSICGICPRATLNHTMHNGVSFFGENGNLGVKWGTTRWISNVLRCSYGWGMVGLGMVGLQQYDQEWAVLSHGVSIGKMITYS